MSSIWSIKEIFNDVEKPEAELILILAMARVLKWLSDNQAVEISWAIKRIHSIHIFSFHLKSCNQISAKGISQLSSRWRRIKRVDPGAKEDLKHLQDDGVCDGSFQGKFRSPSRWRRVWWTYRQTLKDIWFLLSSKDLLSQWDHIESLR